MNPSSVMRIHASSALALLSLFSLLPLGLACSGTTVSTGGTGGTTAATGGTTAATGGSPSCTDPAQVLGKTCAQCVDASGCCSDDFLTTCFKAGGLVNDCMFGEGCNASATTLCAVAPTPGPGQFACFDQLCNMGEVCLYGKLAGDGCEKHSCKAPPPACAPTPTCACLEANATGWAPQPAFGAGGCTEDTAGHLTWTYATQGP